MSNTSGDQGALPCDQRYRTSQYFLEDQLRCSDAAEDFRSVKNLVGKAQSFNLRNAFRFQNTAAAFVRA